MSLLVLRVLYLVFNAPLDLAKQPQVDDRVEKQTVETAGAIT
jgi:hypothetical protein